MDDSALQYLPDELLEAVIFHLPADDTVAFARTCKRGKQIALEHLVWRNHCLQGWRYWDARHDLKNKISDPPAQTKWRYMYNERRKNDKQALELFNDLLATQQNRIHRMEEISKLGDDATDLMMELRDQTPNDAEDVLARRWHAEAILSQIHRKTALDKWTRLQKRQMVRLEEVLGAYDLFVLGGRKGDLKDVDEEFDRIAKDIETSDPEYNDLSIRQKSIRVAEYLRHHRLVGNPNAQEDYHALRNNFISIALFDEAHSSLPLQSVAIYCAVARRLGINARPSNYPAHVHAVIEAPSDMTLDGKWKTVNLDAEPEIMHMDPWRTSEEVPTDQLTLRLTQMGAPAGQHAVFLGATSTLEMALRTSRNIMHSVQEARDRQRGITRRPTYPDIEAAWYSMLWSMLILGDSNAAATLHRRRQCLPYLAEHFQAHFPEDLGLFERIIVPMFESEREHAVLMHLIVTKRAADQNKKAPKPRMEADQNVHNKVGQHFQHKRYGYEAIIVGWDNKCSAEQDWIQQMRVDDLPRGREQPFYHVM